MMNPKVAAIQLSSQDQLLQNLKQVDYWLAKAADQGVNLAVLPENFAVFGANIQQQTAQQFEFIQDWLATRAQSYKLWLVAGTLPCRSRPNGQIIDDGRVRTCSVVLNSSGELCARYDKIHLFDVDVADGQKQYRESATYEAGDQVVVVPTPWGNLGLTICYDLRFPLLFQQLMTKEVDFIAMPAAFTAVTGQAHWQVLLRARAIECQSFMIAAAQGGQHGATRQTWGHSQIIDPWGRVLAEATHQAPDLVVAVCDRQEQAQIRRQMPVLAHRHFFG